MDGTEGYSTDGASIKPVSSLLSHFEGLKVQQKPTRTQSQPRDTPESKSGLEAPRPSYPVRVSLDLPRPNSPWTASTDNIHGAPRTPGDPSKGYTEASKSNHKRPMSMLIQSSPQLTPAVKVDSPQSPPHMFFQRTASASPERIDTTPFGKVRDLVSQHSSRSSTRPPSPGPDGDSAVVRLDNQERRGSARNISPTRQPPPVNRSEKPRIPAKPLAIVQAPTGRLTPESRRPSVAARTSPFSTPPSSGENSPVEKTSHGPSPFSPDTPIESPEIAQSRTITTLANDGESRHVQESSSSYVGHTPGRSTDPRLMGFSALPTVSERKDPRSLGFSSGTSQPPIVMQPPSVPARANTVVERSVVRDPRDLGFSAAKSTQRAVSENIRQMPPPRSTVPITQQPPPLSSANSRDPRQFGFSRDSTIEGTVDGSTKPNLPQRRTGLDPPPRPSEFSKPGAKPVARHSPNRSQEQSIRVVSQQLPRTVAPNIQEPHFPPPPKRKTFSEDDEVGRATHAHLLTRSATISTAQPTVHPDNRHGEDEQTIHDGSINRHEYPDATQTNRRPPFSLDGNYEMHTRSDGRVFDVCGKYLCVTGYITRVYDLTDGEQILSVNHGETVKVTAAKFKPGVNFADEGQKLWLGNNIGDLQEVDISTHAVVTTNSSHTRREIVRILRYRSNLWTLDDDGKLFVWRADETGSPNLKYRHVTHKVPKGHTASMVVQDKLWLATGRELHVYRPGNEAHFGCIANPVVHATAGDITSSAFKIEHGGKAFFGHADGKVSIYSASDYTCIGTIKVSDYKITGLSFVSDKLWVAYKTGMVYVYDVSVYPWKVKKDWRAHQGPAHFMVLDPSSVWTMQRLQVVTAGHDNYVRMWDATLEEDWLEHTMQERDVEYCNFRELHAAVITWNAGAVVPGLVKSEFIADAINPDNPPEILVFGFQEVVDLEDRAVTAKSLLGFAKKKDATKTEQHQSRIYREWRDYIARCITRFTNAQYSYTELNTSSLVGLFQCVFIRQEERRHVSMLSGTDVKCGMGGHYGNKGALVTRFVLDDSSLCFVNCHLAAGQSATSHRNNDVATILESETLPVEHNRHVRTSLFTGGGDGTQILDHEICILNGDLNYRIDTMPRDTVIKMVMANDFSKLLDRDQLLISRRRVTGFRLTPFNELPITFAPTYKYDVGTDHYDSSEKKRSPAWCDRILYRGPGRIKQLNYRRHECRASDHRPVSGLFKLRIKKINVDKRNQLMDECHEQFKLVRKGMAEDVCVRWLVDVMGLNEQEARRLLSSS